MQLMEEGRDQPSLDRMEYMQSVFSMCDGDGDGVISVDELRTIGLQIGWDEQMDSLVEAMDPDGVGTISFDSFCKGITSFLLDKNDVDDDNDGRIQLDVVDGYHGDNNSFVGSGDEVSSVGDTDSAFSTEAEVCPSISSPSPQPVTNGYSEYVANGEGDESITECDMPKHELLQLSCEPSSIHSSPLPSKKHSSLTRCASLTRGNTSPRVRNSLHTKRYSMAALMADEDNVETSLQQMTEQLVSISSERDQAFEEKEVTTARSNKLREDNKQLLQRVLSIEEKLKDTSTSYENKLQAEEKKHRDAVIKLTNQYELKLEEVQCRLITSQSQVQSLQSRNYHLKDKLESLEKQKQELEDKLAEKEQQCRQYNKELQHQLDVARRQSEEWAEEKESLTQELSDQLQKFQSLQSDCDETCSKRFSTSTLDVTGEISTLNKEIDRLKEENDDLRAQFLQHGKSLITQGPSIASELETASKDKIMAALRDSEDTTKRLKQYIEGLLVTIIDRHPELLEKK